MVGEEGVLTRTCIVVDLGVGVWVKGVGGLCWAQGGMKCTPLCRAELLSRRTRVDRIQPQWKKKLLINQQLPLNHNVFVPSPSPLSLFSYSPSHEISLGAEPLSLATTLVALPVTHDHSGTGEPEMPNPTVRAMQSTGFSAFTLSLA